MFKSKNIEVVTPLTIFGHNDARRILNIEIQSNNDFIEFCSSILFLIPEKGVELIKVDGTFFISHGSIISGTCKAVIDNLVSALK